ncbi:MAG: hypothetical protein PHP22_05455 [Oscillospiraceae bacterium]|nr:hypothetical protein [Oscillospiraceae bacterium]
MSDFIAKIIPVLSDYVVTEEEAARVTEWLTTRVQGDQITFRTSDQPEFVDSGDQLLKITCPSCSSELSFDWWGEAVQTSFERSEFSDLIAVTECCGSQVSLNDLHYEAPCGFSRVEFDIYNPAETVGEEVLRQIEEMLGCEVCLIHAHI